MKLFKRAEVVELKNWAQETRNRINEEGYVVKAPAISQVFMVFLQEQYGQQWEVKFLQPAAEPLFEQLLAYVVGYAGITSHNRYLLCGLYEKWTVGERFEKLPMLAESGVFFEVE